MICCEAHAAVGASVMLNLKTAGEAAGFSNCQSQHEQEFAIQHAQRPRSAENMDYGF
jgi:hypothetical protein